MAVAAGKAYVIIDDSLLRIDRVTMPQATTGPITPGNTRPTA
jgi:hypothetical protein